MHQQLNLLLLFAAFLAVLNCPYFSKFLIEFLNLTIVNQLGINNKMYCHFYFFLLLFFIKGREKKEKKQYISVHFGIQTQ